MNAMVPVLGHALPFLLGSHLVSGSSDEYSVSKEEEGGSSYNLHGSSLFAALGLIIDFTSSQVDLGTLRLSVSKGNATLNCT
ncbi:hypothetical protein BDV10DRAFT_178998 [Aspergillus recurvatus]